jgi:2-keto-4-pentenoate hydratase/2-oxohepta-3-ene-1,7-dioic acid hydratase in catechol pathway
MKLITFTSPAGPRLGAVKNNVIIDLPAASGGKLPADMLAFLQQGDKAMSLARKILSRDNLDAFSQPFDENTLLAPVANPSKIMAIGRNYAAHAHEQKMEPPKSPVIFAKYPSAIIGPNQTITWSDSLTQKVDFEAELAVIIGKTARKVSEADALNYVAGYTVCNDVSARDLQFSDKQYTRGKSLDTFCPLGPWLVTADEIANPQSLRLRAILNGQVMQDATTGDMLFGAAQLIAFMSRAFTLFPGDIISTGTPSGVGVFRDPPVFMKDGDEIIIEVEKVGRLRNVCRVEA